MSPFLTVHHVPFCAGRQVPEERDSASAAAAALSIAGGANIIRMHDVSAGKDAARVADAILKK